MVTLPFGGDQKYNAGRVNSGGYGQSVNPYDFTAEEFYEKMQEVINNPIYKENIKKCSRIVHSMPSPQETLVFWVNHILEFGGKHLRPASTDMPYYQIFMWDVLAFIVIVLFTVLLVAVFTIWCVVKYVCFSRKQKRD